MGNGLGIARAVRVSAAGALGLGQGLKNTLRAQSAFLTQVVLTEVDLTGMDLAALDTSLRAAGTLAFLSAVLETSGDKPRCAKMNSLTTG